MINEDNLQGPDKLPLPETEKPARFSQHGYALIIIGVGILTYLNSFEGRFVFDDRLYINSTLQSLRDATFSGFNMARPLIGFTLGINYLISGYQDWSYHLLNLLVHILAALCLFGIVRQTLLTDRLRDIFGARATKLALVIALIWLVHPLQTQSVTYIIQRCESIMGLFYLTTLYCAIKGFASERKTFWYVAAIAASAAGMLSKQVMVTAPIMVLVYDFVFVSASLKTALQKRWGLYLGLGATWILLVVTLVASPVNETAGFSAKALSPFTYFLEQFRVLVHYLRLAVFPDALSIDYGWKKASGIGEVLPYAIPVVMLQLATLWGLVKRHPLAFLGAWFFGILAITSSFMPFTDLVFEHRMYLSLAAVIALIVLGADWLLMRWLRQRNDYAEKWMRVETLATLATVVVLVMILVLLTVRRNMDYKSELVLWQDTVNKQPENARAHSNLGKSLIEIGQFDLAMEHFAQSIQYDPEYVEGHNNYGFALLQLGQPEKATPHLLKALSLRPNFPTAHCNLGQALFALGKSDEAIEHLLKAIDLQPTYTEAYYRLGVAVQKQGQFERALASYHRTLQLDPACVDALNDLAVLLISKESPQTRNLEEALQCAERSVQLTKNSYGKSLDVLAQVYAEMERYTEAIETAQQAAQSMLAKEDKEFATGVEARLKIYQEKADPKTTKTKSARSGSS